MKGCVVDASVVGAAVLQEEYTTAATALITNAQPLYAPNFIYIELGNMVWKRQMRGDLDPEDAVLLLADVLQLPLRTVPSEELLTPALRLALRTRRTVYDCVYLALAIRAGVPLVTADMRFLHALDGTPLRDHLIWVADAL